MCLCLTTSTSLQLSKARDTEEQRSKNAALRVQGGDFSEKGDYSKPPQPNFMHMKEGAEMHMQIFICSKKCTCRYLFAADYQSGDRKEHTNGCNGCFQHPTASSNAMVSNIGESELKMKLLPPPYSPFLKGNLTQVYLR